MTELKTKPTKVTVEDFLSKIADDGIRDDCHALIRIMQKVTGEKPVMWGPSIVGFGLYHYKYESGHEGDMCIAGFSPRKSNLTVYLMPGFNEHGDLLKKLGKYTTGKSCLYFKRLSDVDTRVLEKMISDSVKLVKEKYG
jgi:hypothetical protein